MNHKNLSVKEAEKLGRRVNRIMLNANENANKILASYGLKLSNFTFDICEVEVSDKSSKNDNLSDNLNQELPSPQQSK